MWRASRRSHNALRNPSRHRREPARIETARPGVLGWPDEQPYDRILVSAEAGVVPGELLAQLGTRGAMVLPVAGQLLRLRKTVGTRVVVERFGQCRFVPLRLSLIHISEPTRLGMISY